MRMIKLLSAKRERWSGSTLSCAHILRLCKVLEMGEVDYVGHVQNYVILFWWCCCLLGGIGHQSWADIGSKNQSGSCSAEIHKAFACRALRQIPTMQVKHIKACAGIMERKTACIALSHRLWACSISRVYITWAFEVANCWSWGAIDKPLVNVMPSTLMFCTCVSPSNVLCISNLCFLLSSTKTISSLLLKFRERLLVIAHSVIFFSSEALGFTLTAGTIR